ncbi:putative acyl-CoA dehydrogenase [Rhodococcus erythropolis]|uniref:acyl-CoA dehydrogenase n=1 Tax=Rhodococcus erythropolis TaxID=1833 RepID=UPI000BB393A5|nr:acyl-CoA dehydrogenase [Rhodococcus erythropolis]PBI89433.1 putative acyl-CoA dehydrogenase [Rhodococcus erythropolis]
MTSDLTVILADFFTATWPVDEPIAESTALGDTAWSAFAELGLSLVGVTEEQGGAGGTFEDLMSLAVLAGRHAADIPIVEATTAAWALAEAGLPIEESASYSIPLGQSSLTIDDDGTMRGTLVDIPWGASVDLVVTLTDSGHTVVLKAGDATALPGVDLAGQPRDTLEIAGLKPIAIGSGITANQLQRRVVALRIALTAGALQAISELTRRYVSERVQFGKVIGAFQAVQAHVVQIEQMATMTTAIADRLALESQLHEIDIASAHLVTIENALVAARAAHQAHGAIGMTREYRLQGYTRRLHTWTGDFGEAVELSRRLGATASQNASFAHLVLDDTRPELIP